MSRRKKKKNYSSKIITLILIILSFLYGSFFDQVNETFGLMYDTATENLNNKEEKTQKEIAKIMGISRSYVSRIEKRAITKILREFIRDKKYSD